MQKKASPLGKAFLMLAVRTRLELATPCVTGMYSNQLNYRTNTFNSIASSSKAVAKIYQFFAQPNFFAKKNDIFSNPLVCSKKYSEKLYVNLFFVNFISPKQHYRSGENEANRQNLSLSRLNSHQIKLIVHTN